MSLSEQSCEACRIDAPLISEDEKRTLFPLIPEWKVQTVEGIEQLTRVYTFNNFEAALDFANLVGDIAEEEGHHPALLVEWGRVTVNWWSHKIKGLHKNDAIMAAKTDQLFSKG